MVNLHNKTNTHEIDEKIFFFENFLRKCHNKVLQYAIKHSLTHVKL